MTAREKIEEAERELKMTTETYKRWNSRGDPGMGRWGKAFAALAEAKRLSAASVVPPPTSVYPGTSVYPSETRV